MNDSKIRQLRNSKGVLDIILINKREFQEDGTLYSKAEFIKHLKNKYTRNECVFLRISCDEEIDFREQYTRIGVVYLLAFITTYLTTLKLIPGFIFIKLFTPILFFTILLIYIYRFQLRIYQLRYFRSLLIYIEQEN